MLVLGKSKTVYSLDVSVRVVVAGCYFVKLTLRTFAGEFLAIENFFHLRPPLYTEIIHLTCFSDLDEESVRNFLRVNPSFLEYYVMNHVDQDRLERWLIRKTRKLKNKGSKKASNSLEHDDNKQSGKVMFDLSLMKPKLMNAVLS